MKNNATCPLCGGGYRMGHNGIVEGCDKCLNLVRDEDGFFYEPDEEYITLENQVVRQRPKVSG